MGLLSSFTEHNFTNLVLSYYMPPGQIKLFLEKKSTSLSQ